MEGVKESGEKNPFKLHLLLRKIEGKKVGQLKNGQRYGLMSFRTTDI